MSPRPLWDSPSFTTCSRTTLHVAICSFQRRACEALALPPTDLLASQRFTTRQSRPSQHGPLLTLPFAILAPGVRHSPSPITARLSSSAQQRPIFIPTRHNAKSPGWLAPASQAFTVLHSPLAPSSFEGTAVQLDRTRRRPKEMVHPAQRVAFRPYRCDFVWLVHQHSQAAPSSPVHRLQKCTQAPTGT